MPPKFWEAMIHIVGVFPPVVILHSLLLTVQVAEFMSQSLQVYSYCVLHHGFAVLQIWETEIQQLAAEPAEVRIRKGTETGLAVSSLKGRPWMKIKATCSVLSLRQSFTSVLDMETEVVAIQTAKL